MAEEYHAPPKSQADVSDPAVAHLWRLVQAAAAAVETYDCPETRAWHARAHREWKARFVGDGR